MTHSWRYRLLTSVLHFSRNFFENCLILWPTPVLHITKIIVKLTTNWNSFQKIGAKSGKERILSIVALYNDTSPIHYLNYQQNRSKWRTKIASKTKFMIHAAFDSLFGSIYAQFNSSFRMLWNISNEKKLAVFAMNFDIMNNPRERFVNDVTNKKICCKLSTTARIGDTCRENEINCHRQDFLHILPLTKLFVHPIFFYEIHKKSYFFIKISLC